MSHRDRVGSKTCETSSEHQASFWAGIVRRRDLEVEAVPLAADRLAELVAPIVAPFLAH